MPIDPTTEQITVKRIPAIDCWRIVYDTNGRIMIYEQGSDEIVTGNQVFAGTKEECDAHILSQALHWPSADEAPESPSILALSEKDKEQLKLEAVAYVRQQPTSSLIDFQALYSWEKQALVLLMLSSYAKQAYIKGIIPIENPNAETCWELLKGLILQSTDEQLQALLR